MRLMSTQWTHDAGAVSDRGAGLERDSRRASRAEVLVAPFNDVATTTAIIERHHDALAAVIVEPLQRTIPPAPGFLAELRRITAHYGIVLVFDEVVTGFRLALGGAQEHYGVTPDLCALGKSISGGHPLGVVCGRRDILALADPERREHGDSVLLTGTYSGNPISAAAALACIAELRRPGVYARAGGDGNAAHDDAAAPVRRRPACRCGCWVSRRSSNRGSRRTQVVDHRSALGADRARAAAFTDRLLEAGVVKAHEKLFLSTAHGPEEVARTDRGLRVRRRAARGWGGRLTALPSFRQ